MVGSGVFAGVFELAEGLSRPDNLTGVTLGELEHAGKHPRPDHRRRKARAFLVGPGDDLTWQRRGWRFANRDSSTESDQLFLDSIETRRLYSYQRCRVPERLRGSPARVVTIERRDETVKTGFITLLGRPGVCVDLVTAQKLFNARRNPRSFVCDFSDQQCLQSTWRFFARNQHDC
jgi:hypothetical protein